MRIAPFVFFDVDETLINIKSMFSFRAFYWTWALGAERGQLAECQAAAEIRQLQADGHDRSSVNRHFYRAFRGESQSAVRAAARAWYVHVRHRPDFFLPASLKELRDHQERGTGVVLVSGSCVEILEPLADDLQVDHLLVNRLEVADGRFTGELLPPQTIGEGKRTAIGGFLAHMQADGADCHGYGDHLSDLPLLEAVGHPTVVARDEALLAVALTRGWRVLCHEEGPVRGC